MNSFIKIGRLFYGVSIIIYGIQQIVVKKFRSSILPGFPSWVHEYSVFAISTGIAMVFFGLIILGLFKIQEANRRMIFKYLGVYFFALIFISHLPYLFFVYPHKLSHLGSWGDALKVLAFSGGAFVLVGSFINNYVNKRKNIPFYLKEQNLIQTGRIFFATTIILFGCNHFAYDLSFMVPLWFGNNVFWSYFGGAALIGSGIAIMFKIFIKPVAFLLAIMLFLWFLLLHVPSALTHLYEGGGNQIANAFDALLFCGVALVISQSKNI